MAVRIAINGYGRIGRCLLRAIYERDLHDQLQVVAINELADVKTIAHLTKYDSTHGRFPLSVDVIGEDLEIASKKVKITHESETSSLPWKALDVDLVAECTGSFSDRATAQHHIDVGAKRLLFSHPATNEVDATIVYGFNQTELSGAQTIVSNASCSTNCIIPIIKILHDHFGINSGVTTTIHSAMHDQPVIDAYHHTDLRKTRAAFASIIPVDTGLDKGIDRLLPELAGRFESLAMRVPTVNVSAIDLSVVVEKAVSAQEVNQVLSAAAKGEFNSILGYTEEPLASCDFNHDTRSGIVDASQTRVAGKHLIKIHTWFDNEWGYANRMVDVIQHWSTLWV
ncbi:type I glyceraldehyde-3-phosphate dehydrogenase [Marinibactrum halimedae]|uniref:D-erythrose-4-phosphate dehydrogenase n=1 Tax=Marinibactrum halimedae TaxID=1444977 RepID=A0AA37TD23_9GAMM|nr:glyceraldehyde 3-phosphate dehydrogenase NAD-binding domain-containing protein [Marinibactrum halimedae]MCD9458345.1 erythrose-4-phosphate dehydrogenase [Marinibactrum halimedae]GLS27027.1 D-erythrose-4-phosphate dehydrogenase [Marinibactrum halimedae]